MNLVNDLILPYQVLHGSYSRFLIYLHDPDESFFIVPLSDLENVNKSKHPLLKATGRKRTVELLLGFSSTENSVASTIHQRAILLWDAQTEDALDLAQSLGHETIFEKSDNQLHQLSTDRSSRESLLKTFPIGTGVPDHEFILSTVPALFKNSMPLAEPVFVAERRSYGFPVSFIYSKVDRWYGRAEWFSLTIPDDKVSEMVQQILKDSTAEGSPEFRFLKQQLEQDGRFSEVRLLPDASPAGGIRPILEARSIHKGTITITEEVEGTFSLKDTGVVFPERPREEENLGFLNLKVYLKANSTRNNA